MKYILIAGAVIAGMVLTLVGLAIFTHVFDDHVRAGHFDVYTSPKAADSSVQSALYYRWHELTGRLNGYMLDPNSPDRIVFSTDDIFHGAQALCGVFLYDGRSRAITELRRWPGGAVWSPDSRYILLDGNTVRSLSDGQEVDLTDALSTADGDRVELSFLQWSPDSERVSAQVRISPDGRESDRDLIEISLAPLRARYLATISNSSLVWMEEDVRWVGGALQVAAVSRPDRPIVVKSPDALGWSASPPRAPHKRPPQEGYCSIRDDKAR